MVTSIPILLNCGIVVVFGFVDVTTEWADPLMTVLNPSYKWIDVGSAILASDDWIILE